MGCHSWGPGMCWKDYERARCGRNSIFSELILEHRGKDCVHLSTSLGDSYLLSTSFCDVLR